MSNFNPITRSFDLSRFGKCRARAIHDDKGTSKCYGFLGFEKNADAEETYFKMDR